MSLIALGSGDIKPLVPAFVGDQFDPGNKHRAKLAYDGLYWIIDFGSFFASLLMPLFLRGFGPAIAFGIPGALWVFWLGRGRYVRIPPTPPNPHSLLRVARTALQLERARGAHPVTAVDGVRGVLRVLVVFALVTPFWSLFDQKALTWVLQAPR